jgi:23S rRNA pseudouridine1911/1915/1917 synthase
MMERDRQNTERDNYPRHIEQVFEIKVSKHKEPERIDSYLAGAIKNATRSKVRKAIDEGNVLINGNPAKASRKVQPNDEIKCTIMKAPPLELVPEKIPLEILYEDNYLLVVNKKAGMCVHPGFGNRYGTLVNALLHHFGISESLTIEQDDEDEDEAGDGQIYASGDVRPGIVHRLDKDTSGILVVAKDEATHAALAAQFAERTSEREYRAIVWGTPKIPEGTIEGDIGRSSRDRKVMAVIDKGGKYAKTDYRVIDEFAIASLLSLKLHTGRTHQIRVHSAHIGFPLLGDEPYGGNVISGKAGVPEFRSLAKRVLAAANRQMLHARTLGFMHPHKNEFMRFETEIPADMEKVLSLLAEGVAKPDW